MRNVRRASELPIGTVVHPTYPGAPDTLEFTKARPGEYGWDREMPAGGYVEERHVDQLLATGGCEIRHLPEDRIVNDAERVARTDPDRIAWIERIARDLHAARCIVPTCDEPNDDDRQAASVIWQVSKTDPDRGSTGDLCDKIMRHMARIAWPDDPSPLEEQGYVAGSMASPASTAMNGDLS